MDEFLEELVFDVTDPSDRMSGWSKEEMAAHLLNHCGKRPIGDIEIELKNYGNTLVIRGRFA